jgi:hypothetical protein
MVFSQRHYQGVAKPQECHFHMHGRNAFMGYRLPQDKFLLLDCHNSTNHAKRKKDKKWPTHDLSEVTL